MFFFVLRIQHTEENLDVIFKAIVLSGTITSAIGIAQFLFLFEVLPQKSFPASTFGNGNLAGHIIVLCFPAGFYLLLKQNPRKAADWAYALALVLMLTFAFYTRSRAVWVALSLEGLLLFIFIFLDKHQRPKWLHWNKNKTRASLAALMLLAVLLNADSEGLNPFPEVAIEEFSSLGTSIANPNSARYSIWLSALQMMEINPLIGTGLGSFLDNFNQGYYTIETWNIRRVHNDLLEFGIELGILGYSILIAILICLIKTFTVLARNSSGSNRLAYIATFVALAGTGLNAQVSFPYQLPVPLIILTLYVALIIKGEEELTQNVEEKEINISSFGRLRYAAFAGATLLFMFIIVINGQWWRAYDDLSYKIENPKTQQMFKPDLLFFHPGFIPILRTLSINLEELGEHQRALALTHLLLEPWPHEAFNISMNANHHLGLGNHTQSEKLISMIRKQPVGSYLSEHILLRIYLKEGRTAELRNLYDSFASEPEDSLRRRSENYAALHYLAINLTDYSRIKFFYDQYLKYFRTNTELESNMISYYMNTAQEEKALPHMVKALELDPNVKNADVMRNILIKYSR